MARVREVRTMNSKQQSLMYLMEESNALAALCIRQVHATKSKDQVRIALEHQIGTTLAALKETIEEFELNGERIEFTAEKEFVNRRKRL
jgi:hypothetical protein